MNKIIRRTITVTITETWTIMWPDDGWLDDAPKGKVMTCTRISRKTSVVMAPITNTPQTVDTANQSPLLNHPTPKHRNEEIAYETNQGIADL